MGFKEIRPIELFYSLAEGWREGIHADSSLRQKVMPRAAVNLTYGLKAAARWDHSFLGD
jgi:hypothetical protein